MAESKAKAIEGDKGLIAPTTGTVAPDRKQPGKGNFPGWREQREQKGINDSNQERELEASLPFTRARGFKSASLQKPA